MAALLLVVGILMMLQKWWPRTIEMMAWRATTKSCCLSPDLNDSGVAHQQSMKKARQKSLLLPCCLHTAAWKGFKISYVKVSQKNINFGLIGGYPLDEIKGD